MVFFTQKIAKSGSGHYFWVTLKNGYLLCLIDYIEWLQIIASA
jgi:hypothetical protein